MAVTGGGMMLAWIIALMAGLPNAKIKVSGEAFNLLTQGQTGS
ncbi:MAG: hypothetical protein ABL931_02450 [Usitatibacteraceae bacterium]